MLCLSSPTDEDLGFRIESGYMWRSFARKSVPSEETLALICIIRSLPTGYQLAHELIKVYNIRG